VNDKKYCVYLHINKLNGKQYCGITCQRPSYRWRAGEGYIHNEHFYRAIQKYGWDMFEHIILFENLSHKEANLKEQQYVCTHNLTNSQYGYNQTSGGDGTVGYKHTKDTRKRMSQSHMGNSCSEETKEKISAKNIGNNNGMYGKPSWNSGIPMQDDIKAKISKSRIGKTSGENHYFYGMKHTAETRQKISEANKGKTAWNKGIKTGILPPTARQIGMYDDGGKLIRMFPSVSQAATFVGNCTGNISNCCKGKVKHASGYVWRYLDAR